MNVGHDVNLADTDNLGGRPPAPERPRASTPRPTSRPIYASRSDAVPPAAVKIEARSLFLPALRRWPWLLVGASIGAGLGLVLGLSMWHLTFSTGAQIVRYQPPLATDAYHPQIVNVQTLVGQLHSPEFLRHVGQMMSPPMSGGEVAGNVQVLPERTSDIIHINANANDAGRVTVLANTFAREVVKFSQDIQRHEAEEAEGYVNQQLVETEAQLAEARKVVPVLAMPSPGEEATLTGVAPATTERDRLNDKIQAAQDELAHLLALYTDAYPKVRQQRALIAALQAEAATGIHGSTIAGTSSGPAATPAAPMSRDVLEVSVYRLRELENLRLLLVNRQNAIHLFKSNPPGSLRISIPASGDTLVINRPWLRVTLLATFCGLIGLVLTCGQILMGEVLDNRLKTDDDVTRVTGLPVIATLGDLRKMTLGARDDWAFRTWISLQDQLSYSPNHGLICGITSSHSGDGRSTWVNLLAAAARKCGFRVLTIATKPTADASVESQEPAHASAATNGSTSPMAMAANGTNAPFATAATMTSPNGSAVKAANGMNGSGRTADLSPLRGVSADSEFTAMTASALFSPAEVTAKLTGPDPDPLVHIPLPGWTWNLERRKQWQGALNVWRQIDNVVILVELPPASVPESVLLASNLPNIVWLVESGKSDAAETRAQLDTLRHARCNLVGAVINRAMPSMTQGRFSRWVNCVALIGALGLAGHSLKAQEPAAANPAPAATPATFSIVSSAQRAEWQRRLTLGPGDVMTLSLFGEPELTRKEVPVGPDGRISYLEAQNVVAAGLTVDEFRDRLNQELGKYRREPQVIVLPVTYKSKKYYVLGKVTQRGAFPLDRPITLLEAVARARGVETGMASDRSLVELADLSHSFVARHGQKLPVNFEKLFGEGDLSQNLAIEPDDYIYFPASEMKEVYVLGAVEHPGPYDFTTTTGTLGAIAARGGFTTRAWRDRLLVVRGALDHPQTFVVDAASVLQAKSADIRLQPHDIVYVSDRPWMRAEELLDAAASAFVTSAVVTWTGLHVR
jgi:protein involved in polysaccharide export with SLBB domain/capsular polysaccharide biosynthesis protein